MEGLIFAAFVMIYLGWVIRDAANGYVTLRGGVVRRKDNPVGFWLLIGVAVAWGVLVLAWFVPDSLVPMMRGLTFNWHF